MNIIESHLEQNYRFNHYNKDNDGQIDYLGYGVKRLANSVNKGGILVFFKSYDIPFVFYYTYIS